MATIINNPRSDENTGNGMGLILGIIIFLVLAYLLFYYGLPMIRQSAGPTVNIPDKINVNVNQPK